MRIHTKQPKQYDKKGKIISAKMLLVIVYKIKLIINWRTKVALTIHLLIPKSQSLLHTQTNKGNFQFLLAKANRAKASSTTDEL